MVSYSHFEKRVLDVIRKIKGIAYGICELDVNAKVPLSRLPASATESTPGGSDTQIQYNNAGVLDGASGLTYVAGVLYVNAITTANDQNAQLIIGRQNNVHEGGEIGFIGAGSYDGWILDVYDNTFRCFTNSANTNQVRFYNAGAGIVNVLCEDGSLAVGTQSLIERLTVNGAIALQEMTAPSNTSGFGKIYVKSSDSLLYFKTDGGVEYNLTSAGASLWTDAGTYIHANNTSNELQVGDSGQLTEPVILTKKSIATTGAIGLPTGISGDLNPLGVGGTSVGGGHVGYFGSVVRTSDSSTYNVTPYFFAYKDKAHQNGQNPCMATWMNIAGGAGGTGATAFAGWDILIGHTSGTGRLIGREINIVEARSDKGFHYDNGTTNNWSAGLALVNEHNFESKTGYHTTWGMFVAQSSQAGATCKWNCGIRIAPEALVRGLTYTNYFTGSYPLAIAMQLEKRQALRWCTGDPGGTGFSHANYYPFIVGDDWGQLVIATSSTKWWRFTNTGAFELSTNGGSTWSAYTNP